MKKAKLGILAFLLVGFVGGTSLSVSTLNEALSKEARVYAESETITWDIANSNYSNEFVLPTYNDGDVVFSPAKGDNSNPPKYFDKGTAARFYAKNTLTIESTGGFAITKVDFNVATGSSWEMDVCTTTAGTIENDSIVLQAEDKVTELTWTAGASKSNGNIRIQSISVTLQAESLALPSFEVQAKQKEYSAGSTLSLDDFEVLGELSNGASVTKDDFTIEVGMNFDDLGFIADETFIWDETPLDPDNHNAVSFTSKHPSEPGGATYLTKIVQFDVLVPTEIVLEGQLDNVSCMLDEMIDLSGLRVIAMPGGSDVTDVATLTVQGASVTEESMDSISVRAEWNDLTISGVYEISVSPFYRDRLSLSDTNASAGSSSYVSFEGLLKHSGTSYSGSNAGSYDSIQLSATNGTSGIVSTVTEGLIKEVVVDWHEETSSNAALNVYASNTAFTSAADLHEDGNDVVLIGTIDRSSMSLTIDEDYAFVGIAATSAASYLKSIDFIWSPYGDRTLTSIEIVGELGQTSYYEGDAIDASGLSLQCTYSDGNSIVLKSGFDIEWDTPTAVLGHLDIKATVTYGGLETSRMFNISVLQKAIRYSYEFKQGDLNSGTLTAEGVVWNYYQDSDFLGWDTNASAKGIQLGSSSKPIDNASLSSYFMTEDLGVRISSITVNASVASSGSAELKVYLNGEEKDSFSLTTTATEYTVSNLTGYGVVEIRIVNNANKAVYLKSVQVDCYTDQIGSILVPLAAEISNFDSCNLATSDFETFKANNEETIEKYSSELEALMVLDKASQNQGGHKDTYYSFMDKYNYCVSLLPAGANYMGINVLGGADETKYALAVGLVVVAVAGGLGFAFYKKRKEAR